MTREEKLKLASSNDPENLVFFTNERDPEVLEILLLNPNLPTPFLERLIKSRSLSASQLRTVAENARWVKDYGVRLQLILNPRTPRAVALRYIKDLYQRDLAMVNRNTSVHPGIRASAENYLEIRLLSMATGERVTLARSATMPILRLLLKDPDDRVVKMALNNYRVPEAEILRFVGNKKTPDHRIDFLLNHPKWSNSHAILRLLTSIPNVGYATRRRVFEKCAIPMVIKMIRAPQLDKNHQSLARFVVRQRLKNLMPAELMMMAESHSRTLLFELAAITDNPGVVKRLLDNVYTSSEIVEEIVKAGKDEILIEQVRNHPVWSKSTILQNLIKKSKCSFSSRKSGG